MDYLPQSYRTDGLKRCGTCREEKPLSSFNKHRSTVDQRQVRCIECQAWLHIKRMYDVDRDEYLEVYEKQLGSCATCGARIDLPASGSDRVARLDHCHYSGRPRGLLCRNCNTAMGMVGDNPIILKALLGYIETGGTWGEG